MIFRLAKREHARLKVMPGKHRDALLVSVVLGCVTVISLIVFPAGYGWVMTGIAIGISFWWASRAGKYLGHLLILGGLALPVIELLRTGLPIFQGYLHLIPAMIATLEGLYFVYAPAEETELDRVLRRKPASDPSFAEPLAPRAPGYSWSCAKCKSVNAGHLALCTRCRFPAFFDGRSLEQNR